MSNPRVNWKNLWTAYRVHLSVTLLMVLVVIVTHAIFTPKEIDTWGKNMHKLSKKAFAIDNQLDKKWKKAGYWAINRWNADFRRLGLNIEVFTEREKVPAGKLQHYMLVQIVPAPDFWYVPGKCEYVRLGDQLSADRGMWAQLAPRFEIDKNTKRKKLQGAILYVCTKKVRHALKLHNTPLAGGIQKWKRLGILLHEFSHLFWEDHPNWVGGRFASGSLRYGVTKSGDELLKKYVLPQLW